MNLTQNNISSPLVLKWSESEYQYKVNKPLDQSGEYIDKSLGDELIDALGQCHNLFEAEYQDLSDQGKRVHQVVITVILKATHRT